MSGGIGAVERDGQAAEPGRLQLLNRPRRHKGCGRRGHRYSEARLKSANGASASLTSWFLLLPAHLGLLPLFPPGHLDGLKDALGAFAGVVFKTGEPADPAVEVGEAHVKGIHLGEFFVKLDGNVIGVVRG